MKMQCWWGKGEGRIFSCLSIIANLSFIEFQKRHKVTEAVFFVSVNLSIHQGQNQRLNHHCLCHCLPRKAQEQLWLVKGRRETMFCYVFFFSARRKLPFLLLTVNTMKRSFRLIMPLNLTLPCFLLDFGGKIVFFPQFLQQMNSVRPTRVVCFAWEFPFTLGRAGMITKWSL